MTWTLALLLACAEQVLPPPPLEGSGPSLYDLSVPLTSEATQQIGLDWGRGHPTILSMFYTSCTLACPLLISDIQSVEAALKPEQAADLRVLLISMDPERDDPEALGVIRRERRLDARWMLSRPPSDSVRPIAAVLDLRYRPLPDGNFAHESTLVLVDGAGRVVLRARDGEGRRALVQALGGAAP